MKKKYKIKKSAIIIISIIFILIIALILFVISLFKTKSYSIEYSVKDSEISEYYDDKDKLFYYEIKNENITYNFIYKSKYIKERKLIKEVQSYKEDDTSCITINSDYIKTEPLCSRDDTLIDYHLASETLLNKIDFEKQYEEEIEEEIENYTIYNKNLDIYIWNYKGFNHIHDEKMDFIDLFAKDIYDIPLATKINNYIIVPDYEQDYTFNKVYIINLNDNSKDSWTLKTNISFDSYILGINDKSLYIIDQKNKKEYELVPHKEKMRINATYKQQGIVYNYGEEKKVPMKKLVSEKTSFLYTQIYNYKLIDNKLYLSYLDKGKAIQISDQDITSIISIEGDTIYYLIDTTLYRYNLKYGETKLMKYDEWKFNNKNVVFVNS